MNKVSIYIKDSDGVFQQVDLFEDETISVTSKIKDIRDISKVFTDFSQSFTLPASKKNNKIFRHFYNYHISEGAFDARKKVEARIEINYIPFRDGKIFLNGVKMKNNVAYAYNITFYGNTVSLTDLLGDDELSQLDLSTYDHDYGASQVKTGLTTGLNLGGSTTNLIYPLITHTKRLYFDSRDPEGHNADTLEGNLFKKSNNSHSQAVALTFDDLKPALKVTKIIDAIEAKYGIQFASGNPNDFFDSTPMSNLYLWLSRSKGILGGAEGAEQKVKVLEDWVHSPPNPTTPIVEVTSGRYVYLLDPEGGADRVKFTLTITPNASYTSTQYTSEILLDGVKVAENISVTGTTTLIYDVPFADVGSEEPFTFVVKSDSAFLFTPTLNVQTRIFSSGTIVDEEVLNCGGELSVQSKVLVSEELPKIKVIDFLSGLFKLFNLTAFYIEDISDANYGKIKVITLDDYYDDNPVTFDISKYTDVSETDVEATIPFSEIDFEYKEAKTLLMKQHKETFNDEFGNEEFKPQNVDRGKPYKVQVPFERMKFERLFDVNGDVKKDIQWGYSAGDNFKPEENPKTGQPTGNYEPVLTAPMLFYGIRITGLTTGNGINWYDTTQDELSSYWKPSSTNENGTSTVAPAYTLNFDNEVDEWNLTDYGGDTNSLFKKWYKTYIEDAFNPKKRIFKVTAHLPNRILLNYRLNDRFQIGDKVFTINSIDTNLKTGESKLELLNVL